MRFTVLSVLAVLIVCSESCTSQSQGDYVSHITHYRDSVENAFRRAETSILTESDRVEFEGLPFFPPNESWVVKAEVESIGAAKAVEFETSTDRLAVYRPILYLKFTKEGRQFRLTAFENVAYARRPDYDGSLFIPFTDQTNGAESYGGGRYLDFERSDLKNVVIDFNKSYNPYCAYNDRYSCPIPPMENHLDIRVEAGVMKWHD